MLSVNLKNKDWFWEILEYEFAHPGEITKWFNSASKSDLIKYYRFVFDNIESKLVEPWDGIDVGPVGGGVLSEDGQTDLNEWIIVQGKKLFDLVTEEVKLRRESHYKNTDYSDKLLAELFIICEQSEQEKRENKPISIAIWKELKWH